MLLLGASLVVFLLSHYLFVRFALLLLPVWAFVLLVRTPWSRLATARLPIIVPLFLGWCGLSYLWSADRASTAMGLAELLIQSAVVLVAGILLHVRQVLATVTLVVKGVLVATVTALLVAPGWATQPPAADPALGWHSIFDHKNGLGAFLVLATITLLVSDTRRRWAWLSACGVLLVGAQSSTALGVVLLVCATALWLRAAPRFAAGPRAAYELVTGGFAVLFATVVVLRPEWPALALGRSATLTGRTEIWEAVQRQIAQRPLIGFGWDGVWTPTSPPTLEMWRQARFEAYYAHSGYLELLLQLGAVGAALFLALVVLALVRLAPLRDTRAGAWGLLVLLSFVLGAVSESAPFTGAPALPLLLLLVVVTAQRPRSARHDAAGETREGSLARRHRDHLGPRYQALAAGQ